MKIAIIDNYDSFTYNLVHMVKAITGLEVGVFRNDTTEALDLDEYDKIILSPGPGVPEEAGSLKRIIGKYSNTKSIFGVCLGLQAIAEVFGSKLRNLEEVYHGVSTDIEIISKDEQIFEGIEKIFRGGRYHSWVVDCENIPGHLEVTAIDTVGDIMAITHSDLDIKGVQFHPESILTPDGKQILTNWIRI